MADIEIPYEDIAPDAIVEQEAEAEDDLTELDIEAPEADAAEQHRTIGFGDFDEDDDYR